MNAHQLELLMFAEGNGHRSIETITARSGTTDDSPCRAADTSSCIPILRRSCSNFTILFFCPSLVYLQVKETLL